MSESLDRTIMERAIRLVEAGWTQNAWARTAKDEAVDWEAKEAVSFCAVGAIMRATRDVLGSFEEHGTVISARLSYYKGHFLGELMRANDMGTKDAILALMRDRLAVM